MHIQWNAINMDTDGTCHSVRVNRVFEFEFARNKQQASKQY